MNTCFGAGSCSAQPAPDAAFATQRDPDSNGSQEPPSQNLPGPQRETQRTGDGAPQTGELPARPQRGKADAKSALPRGKQRVGTSWKRGLLVFITQ